MTIPSILLRVVYVSQYVKRVGIIKKIKKNTDHWLGLIKLLKDDQG